MSEHTLEIEQPNREVKAVKVIRKVMLSTLPIIFGIVFLNYIDRSNLSYAAFRVRQDLKLNASQYGLVAGVFYLSYLVFMIPSNLIISKVKATTWLGVLTLVWGISALCMSFVFSYHSLLAVRLLLGAAEAGVFPGIWYYEMQFFPNEYTNFPTAVMDLGQIISQVCSAPLALLIMNMDGLWGWQGWRWLFLLEGALPIVLAIIIWIFMINSPHQIKSLNETEKQWLLNKLQRQNEIVPQSSVDMQDNVLQKDDGENLDTNTKYRTQNGLVSGSSFKAKSQGLQNGDLAKAQEHLHGQSSSEIRNFWAILKKLLVSQQMWVYVNIHICRNIVWHGLMYWFPTMIGNMLEGGNHLNQLNTKQETHLRKEAIMLTMIPYITGSIGLIITTYASYKVGRRKVFVVVSYFSAALFFFISAACIHNFAAGLTMISLAIMGVFAGYALCVPLTMNILDESMRGTGLAYYNVIGNVGAFVGPTLIGLIVDKTHNYRVVLVVLGLVTVYGFVVACFIKEKLNPKHVEYQKLNYLNEDDMQDVGGEENSAVNQGKNALYTDVDNANQSKESNLKEENQKPQYNAKNSLQASGKDLLTQRQNSDKKALINKAEIQMSDM